MTGDRSLPADDDFDPALARRLQPLSHTTPPDLWDAVVGRAAARGATAGRETDGGRARRRPGMTWLAVAAVLAVIVGTGVVVEARRGHDGGQSIDTPADGGGGVPADTSAPTTGTAPGVEIGPTRTLDDPIPEGAFAVVYQAMTVIVASDGAVVGHYVNGSAPISVLDLDWAAQLRTSRPADSGCVPNELGGFPTLLLCDDNTRPVIRVPGEPPHTVASFPLGSGVTGDIIAALPVVPDLGAQPATLVQLNDDSCPQRQAFVIDHLVFAGGAPQESAPIRRLDGADLATAGPMAGESLALGWSADGTEAYVWRYASPCTPELDQPGIYAYRLDGSSRLIVPTVPDVMHVGLVVKRGGTIDPADRPEGWAEWAGPIRPQRAEDPALARDRWNALQIARAELGMTDPEVLATSTVEPGPDWIFTENGLSLRVSPYAAPFGAPATNLRPWVEVGAGTFWPDGNYSLSVKVDDDTGHWQVAVNVPSHDAVVSATYILGGTTLDPTTVLERNGEDQFTFDLDAEPVDVAILRFTWHDADTGEIVGLQRTPLPPGRFAAG